MWWSGQSDRRAGVRHAVLRHVHAGDHSWQRWGMRAHAAACLTVIRTTGTWSEWHRQATAAAAAHGNPWAVGPTHPLRHLDVFIAQSDDCQDRTATVGFDDRVDAGIEPGADQGIDACQRGTLEVGIWKVDHFGYKVTGQHLVEIFVGELHRNGIVSQVSTGARVSKRQLERWIQFHTFAIDDVGQLQAIQPTLWKVLPCWHNQGFTIKAAWARNTVQNVHRFGLAEGDLHRGRWPHHAVRHDAAIDSPIHSVTAVAAVLSLLDLAVTFRTACHRRVVTRGGLWWGPLHLHSGSSHRHPAHHGRRHPGLPQNARARATDTGTRFQHPLFRWQVVAYRSATGRQDRCCDAER